jgi:hypothetical protein
MKIKFDSQDKKKKLIIKATNIRSEQLVCEPIVQNNSE